MPSLTIRTHIVLLCITTVYLSTVECFNIIIKDVSHSDFDRGADALILKLLKQFKPEPKRHKQKRNEIKTIVKILGKNYNNGYPEKKDLRDDEIGTVQNFLLKLNYFINQNTNNHNYEKRDGCNFGFGRPGSHCKRDVYRRHGTTGEIGTLVDRIRKANEDKLNYAQHMVVERAKYSSSSESDSDDERPRGKHKSRFQIVDNAEKKNSRGRLKESTDEGDYDDVPQEGNSDELDELTSEPKIVISDYDGSDQPQTEASDDSEEKSVEKKDSSEKYLYLQGSRLQNPYFRSGRPRVINRRGFRMPYFMPKRYKWDDNMLTHLDEYWTAGIQAYDTYRQKYNKYIRVST